YTYGLWEENCHPPSNASGYDIVDKIRQALDTYGSIIHFKAYLDVSLSAGPKSAKLYSELQDAGVTLAHCPHSGRKDVVDKMLLVDMISYTLYNPSPLTIVLITGDRDFSYGISTLRLRGYGVVVIVPPSAHKCILSIATSVLKWQSDVIDAVVGTTEGLNAEKDVWVIKPPSSHCTDCGHHRHPTSQRVEVAATNVDSAFIEIHSPKSETGRMSDLCGFKFIQMLFLIFNVIAYVWNVCCGILTVVWGISDSAEDNDVPLAKDVDISVVENALSHSRSEAEYLDEKLTNGLRIPKLEAFSQLSPKDEIGITSQKLTASAYPCILVDDELYYDAPETQEVLVNSDNGPKSCNIGEVNSKTHESRDNLGINSCMETPAASAVMLAIHPVHESSASSASMASSASTSTVVSRQVADSIFADPPFRPLIQILNIFPEKKINRGLLGAWLAKQDPGIYKKAGVTKFKTYIEAAVSKGYVIVENESVALASNINNL
ncbi:hypothetical protein BD410DRAFT_122520, partial [Rickenella mellea]